jgi:hypothetical protein
VSLLESPAVIGAVGLVVGGAAGMAAARARTRRGPAGGGVGGAVGTAAAALVWAAGSVRVAAHLDEMASLPWLVAGGLFLWALALPALAVAAVLWRWGRRPNEAGLQPYPPDERQSHTASTE